MMKHLLAALAIATFTLGSAAASPEETAKTFIEQGVSKAIAILQETKPDDPARAARFRDFVDEVIDTRSVAQFTLGHYRKGADPKLVRAFETQFREYATASYESRLGLYGGQTISLKNAIARKDTDVLVKGTINAADGRHLADVAFRVLTTAKGPQLFDVQVEGIWLAVEQRSQFGNFLGQHNGDIQKLVDFLADETARLRSGDGGSGTIAAGG
ncbi:MAG: phospholipid-binding protein MlaC [Candidatus Phaeomarinobacter sp.]